MQTKVLLSGRPKISNGVEKLEKLRFKIKDLVEMLVTKKYDGVISKYRLNKNNIRKLEEALRKGRWRVEG